MTINKNIIKYICCNKIGFILCRKVAKNYYEFKLCKCSQTRRVYSAPTLFGKQKKTIIETQHFTSFASIYSDVY